MTCSGSPGSPAPAEGSHGGWCWLGSVVSEPLQRCPKHALRRSSWTLGSPWLCSVPMLLQEGARLDLFDHADLTCTLCPTAAFLTSSYLLEKKFCFSCKSGGNFFFFLTISVLLELTPKHWFSFSKERREVRGGHLFLQAAARLVYMQGSPSAPWLSLCFTLYLKLSELHCPGSQLYQYLLFYVNSFSA